MPHFNWDCDCGYVEESYDSMDSPCVRECPRCGHMSLIKLIGPGGGINWSCGLKDKSGESIWWPKGESSYFDPAFNRRFDSPEEKKQFMDEHNFISAGSMDSDNNRLKKKLEEYKHQETEKNGKKQSSQ